jgi:hypothetical protein
MDIELAQLRWRGRRVPRRKAAAGARRRSASSGFATGGGRGFVRRDQWRGESDGGTLFRVSLSGALTTLHLFTFADGMNPDVGPVLGSSGLLYGTAVQGGGNGTLATGTFFEFDPAAPYPPVLSLTTVCFNELDECIPPWDSVVGGYVGMVWYSASVHDCQASGRWHGTKQTGGSIEFETLIPLGHADSKITERVYRRDPEIVRPLR